MEKLPHPMNEMGEPYIPQYLVDKECPQEICPNYEAQNCGRDSHHLYFPKNDYLPGYERIFRGQFQVELCRPVHEYVHKTYEAPEKPTHDYMIGYVKGSGAHVPVSVRKREK
jgi:hypothetical protein